MRLLRRLVFFGLILSGPVWAKHWHEDRDQWNWQSQHAGERGYRDDQHGKDCYFPPHDVRLISEYYPPRYRLNLPAGREKKFRRDGHLPPGWEARLQLLPVTVERLLVPIPAEYRRGILDGFAVVYSPQSGMIIDVTSLFGLPR
jgi:hypothetical protein